jgi:hypothetical protein
LDLRLAQWCIAHPPAIKAAPISTSRWMSSPVKASVPAGLAEVAADVDAVADVDACDVVTPPVFAPGGVGGPLPGS